MLVREIILLHSDMPQNDFVSVTSSVMGTQYDHAVMLESPTAYARDDFNSSNFSCTQCSYLCSVWQFYHY
jgi:hypothetical protein